MMTEQCGRCGSPTNTYSVDLSDYVCYECGPVFDWWCDNIMKPGQFYTDFLNTIYLNKKVVS